ncbi:MAG: hypothetical protein E7541_03770 [Ruminococcaceae bacterium]|nr:hypothetical protein [Oscillospiraceae bacterium]
MKKRIALSALLLLLLIGLPLVIYISRDAPDAPEGAIAMIGDYPLTEETLNDYLFTAHVSGQSTKLMDVVKRYARFQIAAEEIEGTTHAMPASQKEKLIKEERENFYRDYEQNDAFCRQYGVTHEDLIRAATTSRLNILNMGRHMTMVFEEHADVKNKQYTADELSSLYETYITQKVDALEFIPIDEEALAVLAAAYPPSGTTEEAKP